MLIDVSSRSVRVHGHPKGAAIGAVARFDLDRRGRVALFGLQESSRLREERVDNLARLSIRNSLAPHLKHLISSDFVFHAAKIGGGGTKAIFFVFNFYANSERLINK